MSSGLQTMEKLRDALTARLQKTLNEPNGLRAEIGGSERTPHLSLWIAPLETQLQDAIVRMVADIERDVYGLADEEDSIFDVMCDAGQNRIEIWLNDPSVESPYGADSGDEEDW